MIVKRDGRNRDSLFDIIPIEYLDVYTRKLKVIIVTVKTI